MSGINQLRLKECSQEQGGGCYNYAVTKRRNRSYCIGQQLGQIKEHNIVLLNQLTVLPHSFTFIQTSHEITVSDSAVPHSFTTSQNLPPVALQASLMSPGEILTVRLYQHDTVTE